VEFVPERTVLQTGDAAGVRFHVQNTSQEPIAIATRQIEQEGIRIWNEDGNEVRAGCPLYTDLSLLLQFTIPPGATVILDNKGFSIGEYNPFEDETDPVSVGCRLPDVPGRYSLRYDLSFPSYDPPHTDQKKWLGTLPTGARNITIVHQSEDLEDASVSPQIRTVHFPEDLSLGRLQLRDATLSPTIASYLEGENFGKAQGEVVVPPGKHLALYLGRDGARDLSPLAKLKPDDLQLLAITNWEEVKDEDLVHLEGLTGLTWLVLEWNGYTGSGLVHLKNMKNLVKLKVGGTSLTDEGIAHLSGLTSLQFFSAYGRGISDSSLEHIRAFTNLKSLWLTETSVTDAGTEIIGELKSLEGLSLANTRIRDEGLAHLRDLANLKTLMVGGNTITDAGMIHLASHKNLETLEIAGNPIGDRGLAVLSDMHDLNFLSAGRTQITDAGLVHLRGLPSLDLLFLTAIGDEGIAHLSTLSKLDNLQIHDAEVTEKSIPHFQRMQSLRVLNLRGAQISEELLKQLQSALPNCSVNTRPGDDGSF
jgi:Leucine-rich repeat (LRR) protein